MMAAPPRPQQVVDKDSDDVAVVRATTVPLALDTSACKPVDASSIDCTDALTQRVGRPSLSRVILSANQNVAACSLLEVTAAAKDDGLRNATGIGFWSSQALAGNQAAEDSGIFVPKVQLVSVGTATLKNGATATLVEFVGVVNCQTSDGSDVARLFKPYMQFAGAADDRVYRNWDHAPNYLISRQVLSLDRTSDVLR